MLVIDLQDGLATLADNHPDIRRMNGKVVLEIIVVVFVVCVVRHAG
jgi:hypothetical protein